MKFVFSYQDLWDLLKNGVTPIGENVTNEQKVAHTDLKNKVYNALFVIHEYVDPDNFEKFGDIDSTKEACNILEKSF